VISVAGRVTAPVGEPVRRRSDARQTALLLKCASFLCGERSSL
jgi:hypothetical protein